MDEIKTTGQNPYLMPLAVVIAGGLIAGAVLLNGGTAEIAKQKNINPTPQNPQQQVGSTDAVAKITEKDHIKGNPDALIKIVEYSDFECPFCKQFHNTMNEVMDKYGASGDVAWVFRQFPLEQLHPVKAQAVAVASECANEQGGNDMFWKFTDRYFELTLTNNRTDIETVIPQIAGEIGLDTTAFNTCRQSGKFDEHIQSDIANAIATGGRGTPWSVVIAPNGKTFPINGAQPRAAVEQIIELAKKEK
jgi:protein-disulfide isomerase